jgi:hypothetical protein
VAAGTRREVVGTVTELGERDGPYGLYPIITVRQADGSEFAVHAFHDVLQNELACVAPKHGDQIGLKYSGPHPEKGYHRYVVRRAGDDSALSWAKYGAEARDDDDDEPDPRGEPELAAGSTNGGSDADIPF